jgi:hypothetical protein
MELQMSCLLQFIFFCILEYVANKNLTSCVTAHQNLQGTTHDFGHKTLKMKKADTQVRIRVDLTVMVFKAKRKVYLLTCTKRNFKGEPGKGIKLAIV